MRYVLLLIVLFSSISFAEVNGTINLTSPPAVTGLTGYALQYCNETSECMDVGRYRCFNDYDSTSYGGKSGWCNSSVITNCYHNGTPTASGSSVCYGNIKETCSTGNWTATNCAASNQTCSAGACVTATTTTTGSTTTTTTTTNATGKTASITITSYPDDFNVTQNQSATKTLTVKNNGELRLYNISLSISGVTWYSVSVAKFSNLSINSSVTFSMQFSPKTTTAVDTYTVTASIATSNVSVSAQKSFKITVLPSNETVEKDIIPKYQNYSSLLQELENNITDLERKGADVSELWTLYNSIKDKLDQTNSSLAGAEYFQANQLLDEIKNTIDSLKVKITEAVIPEGPDFTIIIIVIVIIVIVAGVVVYMSLPPAVLSQKKEASSIKKILNKLKRVKKSEKEGKFRYDFKSK